VRPYHTQQRHFGLAYIRWYNRPHTKRRFFENSVMPTKTRAKYFFLLPGVIWVLAFTIFPLLYSLYLSFTNARLGRSPQWVGLDNYARIFTDSAVTETLGTTAFYSIGSLVLTMVLGTFVAWLFNHDLPGVNQLRAIMTMPLFAAPIALGFLGVTIFNEVDGPVNTIIRALGGQGVQWIVNPWGARFAILIIDVWQWTPFVFIVALAAMQSVPEELIEAARIDTGSGWAIFRHITFPLIAPALGTVALLRLVETFKILDVPVSLTQGGPGLATRSYAFQVYQNGLREFQLGYASAMAYLLVIIASIIAGIYFWRVRARFE
jgi:multiple sugar transport system permease protein